MSSMRFSIGPESRANAVEGQQLGRGPRKLPRADGVQRVARSPGRTTEPKAKCIGRRPRGARSPEKGRAPDTTGRESRECRRRLHSAIEASEDSRNAPEWTKASLLAEIHVGLRSRRRSELWTCGTSHAPGQDLPPASSHRETHDERYFVNRCLIVCPVVAVAGGTFSGARETTWIGGHVPRFAE